MNFFLNYLQNSFISAIIATAGIVIVFYVLYLTSDFVENFIDSVIDKTISFFKIAAVLFIILWILFLSFNIGTGNGNGNEKSGNQKNSGIEKQANSSHNLKKDKIQNIQMLDHIKCNASKDSISCFFNGFEYKTTLHEHWQSKIEDMIEKIKHYNVHEVHLKQDFSGYSQYIYEIKNIFEQKDIKIKEVN